MYVSSRLAIWQVLALALFITLGGVGLPALHAQGQSHGCGCPAPVLREKPTMPAETCCPVDPKDVKKAQKEAEHAQHEAAEACKRQQRAAAEAQRRIDEALAHGNHEIGEANAKLQKRYAEYSEARAHLDSLTSSENVGQASSPTEPATMRSKPETTQTPAAQPAPNSCGKKNHCQ